jgi:oxygen-dependent protoporphyrinogen oxidase
MTPRVVVVGAGISGLSAAWSIAQEARQSGEPLDLTVLDASATAGGHARTERSNGFLIEAGPNGFLDRSAEVRALVDALGLGARLVEARRESRHRYVLLDGTLHAVPDSPRSLLRTPLLSKRGRLRVLCEPLVRSRTHSDESVFDFARRRLGEEAAAALVDTAVAGISAGDSRHLSLDAQFPLLAAMEREHGSLFKAMLARRRSGEKAPRLVSFDAGMATLTATLAERLGAALRLSSPVRSLARQGGEWRVVLESGERLAADSVLLAAPARATARMIASTDAQLAAWLGAVSYAGVAVVALGYRQADVPRPLDGYGYLVARSEGRAALGVVWESSIFPGRAPEGAVLLRAMVGGARRPDIVNWIDEAKVKVVRDELRDTLGIAADPIHQSVVTWPDAIAQYTTGHRGRCAAIGEAVRRHPGLAVCGSSYDGVSFADAVSSGVRAGRALAGSLLGREALLATGAHG